MREEQTERATRADRTAGAAETSDTLGEDGEPKVEGTQDAWTDKAKEVIGPAAERGDEPELETGSDRR